MESVRAIRFMSRLSMEHHTQLFTALGEMRKSAEQTANHLAEQVKSYQSSKAVADEYLWINCCYLWHSVKVLRLLRKCISEHTLAHKPP